jgi:ABC-type dipeptide/oligopeptide/nickel transport system ATPase component
MNWLIEEVRRKIFNQNKNWLAVIVGETGSGKSYTGLKLCEMIDPSFNIDRVVFSAEEFMKLLNSGTLTKGNAILWDETGVGLSAREWYTISNKAINYVLQTFRRDNLAVIFTVPSMDFVDIQLRKLFHAYIETISINRTEKCVWVKFMNIQYSPRFDKIYYKYPRIKVNGKIVVVNRVKVYKPSEQLIQQYEEKKKVFCERLKEEVEKTIKQERLKVERIVDLKEVIENAKLNIDKFIVEKNGRKVIDADLLRIYYNISSDKAKLVKKLLEFECKEVLKPV